MKAQSAMEYLMTYGWAMLLIAIVLGALVQLGVFNSLTFSPRAQPGGCQVYRPYGPWSISLISLSGVCTGEIPQYFAKFNGVNSYINAGNALLLNPQKITIALWMKGLPTAGYPGPITKNADAGELRPFEMYCNPSTSILRFDASNSFSNVQISSGVGVLNGTWHFATMTADGTSLIVYVDGVQKGSVSLIGSLVQTSKPVYIGTSSSGAGYFNGTITNVQIYNASLSANDIQALYVKGMGGAPIDLQYIIGWWPLNGNANDYSGNNNNGVPTNSVFFTTS